MNIWLRSFSCVTPSIRVSCSLKTGTQQKESIRKLHEWQMCKLINLYAKVKLTIKYDWYWALVCPTNGRIYNTCYLFGGFFRVGLLIKMYILKARYLISIRNTSLTRQQILHRPNHTVGISLESEVNQSGTGGGIHLTALFISISIQVFPRNPWKFTGSDDTLPARSSFCNSRELVSLHKNR